MYEVFQVFANIRRPPGFSFGKSLERPDRLGKNHFFCEFCNFGSTDLAKKKLVNYDKFNIATKQHNQIFNPNAFLLPFERCYMILQFYLHTIYIFCIMKMTILELFLICMFKEPNLAEKGQIWRKIF